jgi:hypothetical protein
VDGALAMAWTCIDMAAIPEVRDRLIGNLKSTPDSHGG